FELPDNNSEANADVNDSHSESEEVDIIQELEFGTVDELKYIDEEELAESETEIEAGVVPISSVSLITLK
ncbi:hypothetical protein EC973_006601, partial [Apophysomyces ossiformis]